MGKSPGKWLKTLLFRKKSTRSNYAKPKDNLVTNVSSAKEPVAGLTVHSTSVSQPVPTKNDVNSSHVEAETRTTAEVSCEAGTFVAVHKDVQSANADVGTRVSRDPEKIREEQAAIKAQAAFRGYLARRAFQALKGIIKLQALIRGHLVRRQAVVTLLCLQSIIKLQAAFRGQRVRASDLGQVVHQKLGGRKIMSIKVSGTVKELSSWTGRLRSNSFVKKLLVSSPTVKPLQLFYVESEPNSAWSWLERWTAFRFTLPAVQSKKRGDPKLPKHTMSRTVENEANKLKRNTRTRSIAHGESVVTGTAHESERSKRTLKKIPAQPVDSPQEPQSELEKVKRNLRKVTLNATTDIASDHQEMETEKVKRNVNMRETSSLPTELHDNGEADSADKSSKESPITYAERPQPKVVCEPIVVNSLATCPQIDRSVELKTNEVSEPVVPPENNVKSESLSAVNGQLCSHPTEDQVSVDNQKTSKRRSSSQENGLHSSPTLPSYMAATESAKAKLRCQGSPRVCSDGTEGNGVTPGNGVTRRHSLPSVSNGKVSSLSPRMQRLVQSNGKGSIRDRSLQSSRDGNDKVVQPEWRR